MLRRSELRLTTLQETTTVSGPTFGSSTSTFRSFPVQPQTNAAAQTTTFPHPAH